MTPAKKRTTSRLRGRRSGSAPQKRRNLLWRWRRFLFLLGLLFVAGVAGAGYVLSRIPLPSADPLLYTSFVCAADVQENCNQSNAIAQLHGEENRVNVSLDRMPGVLVEAVLSAEDRDFFEHGGVDPLGIARAAWADIRNKGAEQGGSTITQQYVKNVYLTNERTLARKIKEAVLSVKLEQELSKQEILERYLNTIYFGRGAYGVQAASRAYFGVDVGELDLGQAAYLAGLIRSPESADVARDAAAATSRRRTVLNGMLAEGYIDASERDAAAASAWTDATTPGVDCAAPNIACYLPRTERQGFGEVKGAQFGTEYFVEYVHQQLLARGYSDAEIYGGGLKIYTTIDLHLQQAAFEAVASTLDRPEDPSAAVVAIDGLGYVRAMVGGRDFTTNKVNLAVGQEGGGSGRQAGSSMKPFVLATAVKQGISLQSKFNAPGTIVIPRANAGKDWEVHNYGGTEQGVLSIVDATRVSSNTVYAQLMVKVGPVPVVDLAERMGIRSKLDPYNALVLGSEEVSVIDMASAYSTFADKGVHTTPLVVTRVERGDGSVDVFPQQHDEVLSRQENNLVTYCLRQVIEAGTGTGAKLGKPAAGKTGTTQDNRDAWFVGFTPNGFTTAVWMGYPDVGPDGKPRYMDDVHGRAVTGGSFPATIWRKFMQVATDGVDVGNFTTPGSFPGKILNPELDTTTTSESTTTTEETTTVPSTSTSRVVTTTTSTVTSTSTTVPSSTVPSSTTVTVKPP